MNIQQLEELQQEINADADYVAEANFGMTESTAALDAERQFIWEEDMIAAQDDLEARGPVPFAAKGDSAFLDDIPF